MRRGAVFLPFALAAIAACRFGVSTVDLFGNDAGTTSGDGGVVVLEDGAVVGPDGGPAGKPFRCTDHPTAAFCTDFDTPPVDYLWDDTTIDPACKIDLDTAFFVSQPSSFHSGKSATTSGNATGTVSKKLKQAFTKMHLEFDVLLRDLPEQNEKYVFFYLCVDTATAGCGGAGGLELLMKRQGLAVQEDVGPRDGGQEYFEYDFAFPAVPKLGVFTHLAFDLTLAKPSASTVQVTVDGVPKLGAMGQAAQVHTWMDDDPIMHVGLFYVYPTPARDVWIDNFFVELN